tara:strand:+ start:507 stop:926 length:420 start_codon:yes stop_codon:yes gene_type:complete
MKMHKDCKQVKNMVALWYETQMGCIHKCKEKQFEFADMMWELYNNKDKTKKGENKMGRAIDMENKLGALETRVKLVEDALTEMIQTRVHHVDLHDEMDRHEEAIRKENTKGVEVEPDEEFLPPAGKRKKTTKTKTATVG